MWQMMRSARLVSILSLYPIQNHFLTAPSLLVCFLTVQSLSNGLLVIICYLGRTHTLSSEQQETTIVRADAAWYGRAKIWEIGAILNEQ